MSVEVVHILIVNVGIQAVVLYPQTVLGTLGYAHFVSLKTVPEEMNVSVTVSLQVVPSSVQDKITT